MGHLPINNVQTSIFHHIELRNAGETAESVFPCSSYYLLSLSLSLSFSFSPSPCLSFSFFLLPLSLFLCLYLSFSASLFVHLFPLFFLSLSLSPPLFLSYSLLVSHIQPSMRHFVRFWSSLRPLFLPSYLHYPRSYTFLTNSSR